MPLSNFISAINSKLSGLLPDIKVYGLTNLIQRGTETFPAIIDKTGEGTYVGFDDIQSAIIYHRNTGITVTRKTQQGYGDVHSDVINTYAMSMFIYLDHKKSCLIPDEFFLYLQSNFPDAIKEDPFSFIRVNITSVILNQQQLINTEYAGSDFKIPAEKSFFALTYNIETTLKKKCFEKCPEVIN